MKIAHVTDFYLPRLGGIEMQVADLAARQQAQGHEVTIITSSPGDGVQDPLEGPRVLRVTEDFRRPRAIHPRAPFTGAYALLDGGFDAVHVHVGVGSPLAFWAALCAVRAGLPTVITVHSLWAWVYPIFKTLDKVGGFSRRPIRWTAVSEAAAGPVRRIVQPDSAVTVLPNGIDPEQWAVERLPRPADEVLLVAVMRLAPRKRPLHLLRMLRATRKRTPDGIRLRAVIVGDGPERPTLERYLRRHGMDDWVSMPGRQPREQIRELYRSADVFVAPADLESFGIAALEARCAGVPVVAKAQSGIAEFVRHGVDGLLVASDAGMVDALVQLAGDHDLRREMAASRQTAVSWDGTLALTEQAYRDAAVLAGSELPEPVRASS